MKLKHFKDGQEKENKMIVNPNGQASKPEKKEKPAAPAAPVDSKKKAAKE